MKKILICLFFLVSTIHLTHQCTSEGQDPYVTGSYLDCCQNTKKCLNNWDNAGRWYYKCMSCGYQCSDNNPCTGGGGGGGGGSSGNYALQSSWSGWSFFDQFNFDTYADPTHGFVNYIGRSDCQNRKLIDVQNGKVIMKADTSEQPGDGRKSVRITSKSSYSSGLVILDLNHMPQGCGTWPAFWMVGPNWPNSGEIDIIEGVNDHGPNACTLHTNGGCDMSSVDQNLFSGHWSTGKNGNHADNCDVNAGDQWANQGCGIINSQSNSYGPAMNNVGGGVSIMELVQNQYIKSWFFERSQIPADVQSGNPNPSSWRKPDAYFRLGSNCPSSHFHDLSIVINLTFCGDWAGGSFAGQCPQIHQSCNDYVRYNPGAFNNAYWSINKLDVYQSKSYGSVEQ